jgi:hypothetical protein
MPPSPSLPTLAAGEPPLPTPARAALHKSGRRRRSSPLQLRLQAQELRRARPSATSSPEQRWPMASSRGGRPEQRWLAAKSREGRRPEQGRPAVAHFAGEAGGGRSRRARRLEWGRRRWVDLGERWRNKKGKKLEIGNFTKKPYLELCLFF